VIKVYKRKNSLHPRFEGPYQVLLVTNTAVKVKERPTWTHASHCKKVPTPEENEIICNDGCDSLELCHEHKLSIMEKCRTV